MPEHRWIETSVSVFLIAVVAFALPVSATTGIMLRNPKGSVIVVAADSRLTWSTGFLGQGCKIVQISKRYWFFMTGLATGQDDKFYPYGIALHAASSASSLDAVVSEFKEGIAQALPTVATHLRKSIGAENFKDEYDIKGVPLIEAIFWGVENRELKLFIVDFNAHVGKQKAERIEIVPTVRVCPGDCPPSDTATVLPMGNHEVIDRFTHDDTNKPWLSRQNIDDLPGQLVQMEIDKDPGCDCGPPINVLHMDTERTYWVGAHADGLQEPVLDFPPVLVLYTVFTK